MAGLVDGKSMNRYIWINGERHPFHLGLSLEDVLSQLAMVGKRIAVERNGDIVPRSLYGTCLLNEDDRLEVVHAIGGG